MLCGHPRPRASLPYILLAHRAHCCRLVPLGSPPALALVSVTASLSAPQSAHSRRSHTSTPHMRPLLALHPFIFVALMPRPPLPIGALVGLQLPPHAQHHIRRLCAHMHAAPRPLYVLVHSALRTAPRLLAPASPRLHPTCMPAACRGARTSI
ncbi:hypothetical protein B0H14DRAFT_470088 [Mycena olivaceomarginata]|nr:hypothetical protein B0H14DRAFT_470088 [Mycena olivaceomarginata]